jgi:hypothetical protein
MTPLRKPIYLLTAIAALCLLLCALPAGASTGRHEIAFIDSGVQDAQVLADGIRPGVEVVRLDAGRDGVVQMGEVLAGSRDVQAIHIISHGAPGKVLLGTGALSAETLRDYDAQLKTIGKALGEGGDILLYGCNVAQGADGEGLVTALARDTHATVVASTDLTGAAVKGGNWKLEYATGKGNSVNAVSEEALSRYKEVLAVTNVTTGAEFVSALGSYNAGDTITLGADITLTADLAYVGAGSGLTKTLTIDGKGHSINGANTYGGFWVAPTGTMTLTLKNTTFQNFDDTNTATGVVYLDVNGTSTNETLLVQNCVFRNNADQTGVIATAMGISSATITIENSAFYNNTGINTGGVD